MPIYDYRCTQCGHEVEVMHPITGAGPTACERCGGAMRKALSPPAIHFKGSGWAKKDAQAASKPKADKTPGETSGASGGEGGSSDGADTPGSGDKGAGETAAGEKPAKAAAASGTASD